MAYDATKLRLVSSAIAGVAPSHWDYVSADADATLVGSGYFSDGVTRGMKVGDLVDVVNLTGPKYKKYQVASVSGAAATVAAPTAIT